MLSIGDCGMRTLAASAHLRFTAFAVMTVWEISIALEFCLLWAIMNRSLACSATVFAVVRYVKVSRSSSQLLASCLVSPLHRIQHCCHTFSSKSTLGLTLALAKKRVGIGVKSCYSNHTC